MLGSLKGIPASTILLLSLLSCGIWAGLPNKGIWRKWAKWDDCANVVGNCVKKRERECSPKPGDCGDSSSQTANCSPALCCRGNRRKRAEACNVYWSQWNAWEPCFKAVGSCRKTRYRTCVTEDGCKPRCPGSTSQTATCGQANCCQVQLGVWGPWSSCSRIGDRCQTTRERPCKGNRKCCRGTTKQQEPCHTDACEKELLDHWLKEWLLDWSDPENKFPPIKFTKIQQTYWRSLSEYVDDEDEDEETRKPRDLIGSRQKRATAEKIPRPKRKRQEWRQLSAESRKRFIEAFNSVAAYRPDGGSKDTVHDMFVKSHRGSNSSGAHGGRSFLPWHREYLWRFTNALRKQGYKGSIPYFDSSLDRPLPNILHSALWTTSSNGLGRLEGVLGAPFNRSVTTSIKECGDVTRKARVGEKPFFFQRDSIFQDDNCYHLMAEKLEGQHGRIHNFFGEGSSMGRTGCSPSDPMFWLHHAFVDCVWEDYRQAKQSPMKRAAQYPVPEGNKIESEWNADMKPFDDKGLWNIHGMSNHYTNLYYKCAPSPANICCKRDSDCSRVPNPMLWCDKAVKWCTAKIKENGDCRQDWPNNQCWCENDKAKPSCRGGTCQCA